MQTTTKRKMSVTQGCVIRCVALNTVKIPLVNKTIPLVTVIVPVS